MVQDPSLGRVPRPNALRTASQGGRQTRANEDAQSSTQLCRAMYATALRLAGDLYGDFAVVHADGAADELVLPKALEEAPAESLQMLSSTMAAQARIALRGVVWTTARTNAGFPAALEFGALRSRPSVRWLSSLAWTVCAFRVCVFVSSD